MKLINKLITKTAIYKHLKDLYEQALKEIQDLRDSYSKCIDKKEKLEKELSNQEVSIHEFYETNTIIKFKKQLRKIRTYVNKLDKKNENVKEIKRLIKEVL